MFEDALLEQNGYVDNLGLRDQFLALAWVNAHISEYGGDPNNVQIQGESAGASSVIALLQAQIPGTERLIHSAVALCPYPDVGE